MLIELGPSHQYKTVELLCRHQHKHTANLSYSFRDNTSDRFGDSPTASQAIQELLHPVATTVHIMAFVMKDSRH